MILEQFADVVFLVGGMVLNTFAFLALLDDDTSFPRCQAAGYGAVVYLFAFTYADMGMWLSFGSFLLGGIVWTLIAVYRGP